MARPTNGRRTHHAPLATREQRDRLGGSPGCHQHHLPNSRRIGRCKCGDGGRPDPRPGGTTREELPWIPADVCLSPGDRQDLSYIPAHLAEAGWSGDMSSGVRTPEGGRPFLAVVACCPASLRRARCPVRGTSVRSSRHPEGYGGPLAPRWSGRSVSWLPSQSIRRRRTFFPAAPRSCRVDHRPSLDRPLGRRAIRPTGGSGDSATPARTRPRSRPDGRRQASTRSPAPSRRRSPGAVLIGPDSSSRVSRPASLRLRRFSRP
jgi:hypothetical protein